jgi:hypothetical protein
VSAKPILVVSADWHLMPGAWKRHPGLEGDAYFSLQQIGDLCRSLQVPLLGLGDLYDSNTPDSRSVLEAVTILDHMGTPFYYISGDHDLADPPWFVAVKRGLWIHNRTVEVGGFRLYGLDFAPAKQSRRWLQSVPSGSILATHQKWKDLVPELTNDALSFSDLPTACTVLTGDAHIARIGAFIAGDGTYGQYVSPGPICAQSLKESSEKSVYVMDEKGGFHPYLLKTRKMLRYNLSTQEQLEQFFQISDDVLFGPVPGLPESMSKPLIEVRYSDTLVEAYDRLTERLRGRCFLDLVSISQAYELPTADTTQSPESMITSDLVARFGLSPAEALADAAKALWLTPKSALPEVIKNLSITKGTA